MSTKRMSGSSLSQSSTTVTSTLAFENHSLLWLVFPLIKVVTDNAQLHVGHLAYARCQIRIIEEVSMLRVYVVFRADRIQQLIYKWHFCCHAC